MFIALAPDFLLKFKESEHALRNAKVGTQSISFLSRARS